MRGQKECADRQEKMKRQEGMAEEFDPLSTRDGCRPYHR